MPKKRKYTDEQIEYLREISPGRYNTEITNMFNEKFGTNVTESQIKSLKANYKIRSGVHCRRRTRPKKIFTKEQEEFLRKNAKGIHNKDLTELVNKKFNLNVSVDQVRNWKQRNRISSGLRGSEGISPPNKGTKGLYNVGGNRTSFKPGQKPQNYRPIGSERICSKDGYTLIKVKDEGSYQERWRNKHVVMWEEAYGPVPDGYVVAFKDQDKTNITLDNLMLVSRRQLAMLNKHNLLSEYPELNEIGITIADLYLKISERSEEL